MATTVTERPVPMTQPDGAPRDDGLFGPQSVTWRVMAGVVPSIAGPCAVAIQALLPRAMHLFASTSSYLKDPTERGRLTQEYFQTIAFADTATAEHAGALLRNIHHSKTATDPATGELYHADEPSLLLWVHTTWVWALLHAAARYGPTLTPAEQDRFVAEQKVAARLVGLDPELAPATAAEVEAYLKRMRPQLALTLDVVTMGAALAKQTSGPKPSFAKVVLDMAAVDLIPPDLRALLGIRWQRWERMLARRGAGAVAAAVNRKLLQPGALAELRAQTELHAFGGKMRNAR